VQPLTAKADDGQISTLTSALAYSEVVRVIDENPSHRNE